jgi:hypothetical protein
LVDNEVRYRSLLVSKRLRVSQIAHAKFLIGFSGVKPFQRVVFRMRDRNDEIMLNAGLFEPKAIRTWVEHLNQRLDAGL